MDVLHYVLGVLDHPVVRAGLRYVLAGSALLTAAWLVYFARTTASMPYPIEYREGAAQVMTQFLLKGMNPFALENQPLGTNNYGIVYGLIVWPFAVLFGNTLLIHRAVTFVFIVLSAVLVGRTVYASGNEAGLAAALGVLVAAALATRGGLGAVPSSTGEFFFLAAIIVPFRRGFDRAGLIVSACLCLLAFYTKPYFVLAWAIVATYVFLVVSKKRALLYGFGFACLFVAISILVRVFFPLYYWDVVASNVSQIDVVHQHLIKQLSQLVKEFRAVLLVALTALAAGAFGRRLWFGQIATLVTRANVRLLDRPLFVGRLNCFAYATLCATLAFVLSLGLHIGSYMTYAYQLMLPPFLIWLGQQLRPHSRLVWVQVPLLVLNLATFSQARLNPAFLKQASAKPWARLYEIVEDSSRILNSPVLVPAMIKLGMQPVDSGQTEYYYNISRKQYPLDNLLGPSYDVLTANGEDYIHSVNASMANEDYDYVMVTGGGANFFDEDLLHRHYRQKLAISVNMPQTGNEWTVGIWVPIQK